MKTIAGKLMSHALMVLSGFLLTLAAQASHASTNMTAETNEVIERHAD